MATQTDAASRPREPLSTARVLGAAIALADEGGVDALSMRRLAQELGVVPMALYKHVAGKDELLDRMVDAVVGEIEPAPDATGWKDAVRGRVLSARRALLRHPWASRVIESRPEPTPAVLAHMDAIVGILRGGGFSIDLAHHAVHTMGSRLLGFSQELFDDSVDLSPEMVPVMLQQLAGYPHLAEMLAGITHDAGTVVGGSGCDDQFEFEFALDLLLDGLDRRRDAG